MKPNETMGPVQAMKTGWWPGTCALASKVAGVGVGSALAAMPGPTVGTAGLSPHSLYLKSLYKY